MIPRHTKLSLCTLSLAKTGMGPTSKMPIWCHHLYNCPWWDFNLSKLVYLISDITFTSSTGEVLYREGIITLVNVRDGQNLHFIPDVEIPEGSYTVTFRFGFNDEDNDMNHPDLNSADGGWNVPDMLGGGYHYMRMEGKYTNSTTVPARSTFSTIPLERTNIRRCLPVLGLWIDPRYLLWGKSGRNNHYRRFGDWKLRWMWPNGLKTKHLGPYAALYHVDAQFQCPDHDEPKWLQWGFQPRKCGSRRLINSELMHYRLAFCVLLLSLVACNQDDGNGGTLLPGNALRLPAFLKPNILPCPTWRKTVNGRRHSTGEKSCFLIPFFRPMAHVCATCHRPKMPSPIPDSSASGLMAVSGSETPCPSKPNLELRTKFFWGWTRPVHKAQALGPLPTP